jgi:hypothetical protein
MFIPPGPFSFDGIISIMKGQAMLLAVLALGGAILGATTIAGLLMLYQIRATTDSQNSAKAIFAADAGVEWSLFDFYCMLATPPRCAIPPEPPLPGSPAGTLGNSAVATTTCYDSSDTPVSCADTANANYSISKGTSLNSKRAFFLDLRSATATLP